MRKPIRRVPQPSSDAEAADRVQAIVRARELLRTAVGQLRPAAPQAAAYVARALKSVDGALRHADRWRYREQRQRNAGA